MPSCARRKTRSVLVGSLEIGGSAPVSIQTMTKVPAEDVAGTLAQIREAADAGCDLVRCAVPSLTAIPAFA
ncbi:MAG: flavodoxin-dependent (E)-4-hydroxy-3-methylbut-2-enyl-diphosphate synthase, partial [Chthoniobacteraceae bacterium]|nr:flavodoxin-dependent (E)-4-hydroxy-3-methylbut-2-enyl-diphosphate synthase [Chthoniobacteraceae bacterium]